MSYKTADLRWLNDSIARGQSGPHADFVLMTPEVAAEILRNNPENRVFQPKLQSFIADIKTDRWMLNGESTILSIDGKLNDGQHRLLAIVKTGISAPLTVVFGIERETRISVDQGTARSAKDYLAMQGVSNATGLAAITKYVLWYEAGDGTKFKGTKETTNAQIVERALNDCRLQEIASWSASHAHHLKGICRPAILGTAYYILSKVDAAKADEYIKQVLLGEYIARGNPAFAVRQALMADRAREPAAMLEVIFRGWAAHRKGEKLVLAKILGVLPPIGDQS